MEVVGHVLISWVTEGEGGTFGVGGLELGGGYRSPGKERRSWCVQSGRDLGGSVWSRVWVGVAGVTLGSCRQGLWLWQRPCPEFRGGRGDRASRGDLVSCGQRAGRGHRGLREMSQEAAVESGKEGARDGENRMHLVKTFRGWGPGDLGLAHRVSGLAGLSLVGDLDLRPSGEAMVAKNTVIQGICISWATLTRR